MTTKIMSALISGLLATRIVAAVVIAHSPCPQTPDLSNPSGRCVTEGWCQTPLFEVVLPIRQTAKSSLRATLPVGLTSRGLFYATKTG
jgi:hypothetical protein